MRILTAGGGSGGHVTPVVAVLRELKQRYPEAEVRFWCDRHFEGQARSLVQAYDATLPVETIVAGKLRRYHSLSVFRQLLRFRTMVWPNLRDGFKVLAGIIQSLYKLIAWRPDVIFTKGGYVCLPIGVAARILHIPLIIHDSDAHPGLTNRVLARWADTILTGAPLEYYPYPASKSRYVGIPITVNLAEPQLTPAERRQVLDLPSDRPLVVCTGGGLGAQRINAAIIDNLEHLLDDATVVLVTGQANYEQTVQDAGQYAEDERLKIYPFISGNLHEYFAAADVVITRAGMTTLLELAALGRPTIIIPNIYLTGGHQTKNAAVYEEAGGAIVLTESDFDDQPQLLAETVRQLLNDEGRRQQLSQSIQSLAKPQAAKETVDSIELVLEQRGANL